jgi:hypothetical protein
MPFTILANSTLSDAPTLNNNFYHAAQGTRLPRTGISLTETTGTYDLGNATYKWNSIYANKIYTDSITTSGNVFIKYLEINLSASTNRIEITGLNGDVNNFMNLKLHIIGTSGQIYYLHFNGDSGANYSWQYAWVYGVNAVGQFLLSATGIILNKSVISTAAHFISDNWLCFRSGIQRTLLGTFANDLATSSAYSVGKSNGLWYNTTDTITSLVLDCGTTTGFGIGTKIEFWGIK